LPLPARLENEPHGEKIFIEAKDFPNLAIMSNNEAGTIDNREDLIVIGTENVECPFVHFLGNPYYSETARLYQVLDDGVECQGFLVVVVDCSVSF
jgi:hypothetical protein